MVISRLFSAQPMSILGFFSTAIKHKNIKPYGIFLFPNIIFLTFVIAKNQPKNVLKRQTMQIIYFLLGVTLSFFFHAYTSLSTFLLISKYQYKSNLFPKPALFTTYVQ